MKYQYSFTSTWQLEAALADVWTAIYESEKWPAWWPDIASVTELAKGDEQDIGNIRVYKIKSPMLYTLSFSLQLTEKTEYRFLKGTASGELAGSGAWYFKEVSGITHVECHWNVSTNINWMNKLAFLLRPVFSFNHGIVMRNGARALARLLNAKLIKAS